MILIVKTLFILTGEQIAAVWRETMRRRWNTVVRIKDNLKHSITNIKQNDGSIWKQRMTFFFIFFYAPDEQLEGNYHKEEGFQEAKSWDCLRLEEKQSEEDTCPGSGSWWGSWSWRWTPGLPGSSGTQTLTKISGWEPQFCMMLSMLPHHHHWYQ